jgi:hypothetical protein
VLGGSAALGDRPQVGRQYCENADLPKSTGSV